MAEGLWRLKLAHGKGYFKVGVGKKHGEANSLFLEINGSRKFEIGNDCDTCHFWFKCLSEPRALTQKKIVNLPKTISIPRPIDQQLLEELSPVLDILDKGEYYAFQTTIPLAGPYAFDDESSYFFNNEFMEIWSIEDPAQEDLLSGWEHYEGSKPRLYRHTDMLEKHYDFVIPLVPKRTLRDEYIKLYQQMIANGDRPRVLLLGLLQRAIPESVSSGQVKNLHSFFAGFVLDGHHKLEAYRRAGVPANCLVLLSAKASKYFLLKEEGGAVKQKFEDRLASLAV
ncbi:MAG: hypothetical protein HY554_13810 [Elusimicrobia bacterium]|nr:hypothetical protein [Elusimicrobiota bacterium]